MLFCEVVPDIVADVFPSRIQCLWGGQRAAEQSTQSSEEKLHLHTNSVNKTQEPNVFLPLYVRSVPDFPLNLLCFHSEAVSLLLCALHPSLLLPLLWVVLWLHSSQRGQSSQVSSSHFLGKSEPLPSIQPDTESFKDGRTLTHETRRTHWRGHVEMQTPNPEVSPFPRIYCWQSFRKWWRTHESGPKIIMSSLLLSFNSSNS